MNIAKFENIRAMKSAVNESGNRFFTPGAMEFFHTQIETPLIYGSYFVTSEYMEDPAEKKYTARYFTERFHTVPASAHMRYSDENIGEFQAYDSVAEAREAIAEFYVNNQLAGEVESILRSAGGLEYFEAESGYMWLRREDGRAVRADIFGRGTVLARSGVKLHAKDDVYEIPVGDLNTPRKFGEYVRSLADKMIEGGSDLA